ncbi:hypothetical protein [Anaerobaca lacustris]|uniref:Uncharacterized protein n=1 Tax=Anaerobaca lacustris TaxID=3044600 RepID=A0AAW6U7Y1_9BACT|nr:hypothetical protein [Sedimentisphaerales bacterium M17dextr]
MATDEAPDLERGYFDAYASATTNLRTWLVAYGIGAPVLFLSNDTLWQALAGAQCASCVGMLFLGGVGFQVLIALINKNAMWFCYYAESKPAFKSSRTYKVCAWLSEQFWIDMILDVLSIVFFIVATYRVFVAVVRSSSS